MALLPTSLMRRWSKTAPEQQPQAPHFMKLAGAAAPGVPPLALATAAALHAHAVSHAYASSLALPLHAVSVSHAASASRAVRLELPGVEEVVLADAPAGKATAQRYSSSLSTATTTASSHRPDRSDTSSTTIKTSTAGSTWDAMPMDLWSCPDDSMSQPSHDSIRSAVLPSPIGCHRGAGGGASGGGSLAYDRRAAAFAAAASAATAATVVTVATVETLEQAKLPRRMRAASASPSPAASPPSMVRSLTARARSADGRRQCPLAPQLPRAPHQRSRSLQDARAASERKVLSRPSASPPASPPARARPRSRYRSAAPEEAASTALLFVAVPHLIDESWKTSLREEEEWGGLVPSSRPGMSTALPPALFCPIISAHGPSVLVPEVNENWKASLRVESPLLRSIDEERSTVPPIVAVDNLAQVLSLRRHSPRPRDPCNTCNPTGDGDTNTNAGSGNAPPAGFAKLPLGKSPERKRSSERGDSYHHMREVADYSGTTRLVLREPTRMQSAPAASPPGRRQLPSRSPDAVAAKRAVLAARGYNVRDALFAAPIG